MFNVDKLSLNKLADDLNFTRNTVEKVLRLNLILKFINENKLKGLLVLKGGTAINLFLLDLPRLSVDLDLDFNLNIPKEDMLIKRKEIDNLLRNYMINEGYELSTKSKFYYTLDSYMFSYKTLSGSNDVLKIEINYSNRLHIFSPIISTSTSKLYNTANALRLTNEELIGSKFNALITRTTPRDVYDAYELFNSKLKLNFNLIRKVTLFYVCLGVDKPINFKILLDNCINKIESLTFNKIKHTLIPVSKKAEKVNINEVGYFVIKNIKKIFELDTNDINFIDEFNKNNYTPHILFDGFDIRDISNHPMALWKISQ